MSRIQDAVAAKLPASNIPLPTAGGAPTPAPSYANYVSQIEANKGAQLRFSQPSDSPFFGLTAEGRAQASNQASINPFFGSTAEGRAQASNQASINPFFGSTAEGRAQANSPVADPTQQRLSNVYRYIANYNKIDPQQLANGVSQSDIASRSPTFDGHNYFNDYVSGVAAPASMARPIAAPISAPMPVQSSSILGASSQGTGNFLDNTPSPQGFSMGGLITPDQSMQTPMLAGYATGGTIGQPPMPAPQGQVGLAPAGGAPMGATQGQAPQQPQPNANPQMFDSQSADLLNQHPEIKQQIQKAVQQALASGQLTTQEAQLGVQLAQACINNPALWPQLRAFAIQNGLATDAQIPQQYDQGLVMAILIAAKAVQDPSNGGGAKGRYATGGMITGPGTGTSDSIPATTDSGSSIKVSNGEYIIPKNVVLAKGTDFFDKLIESYHPDNRNK